MADTSSQDLVASVARQVIGDVAPRELPLFRPISQAYFKDPEKALKGGGGTDKLLGFGAAAAVGTLRTPLILRSTQTAVEAFTAGVVRQLDAELRRVEGWVGEMRSASSASTIAESPAPEPAAALTPGPDLVVQVRLLLAQQLLQLGTGEPECSELADRVCNALASGKMAEELLGNATPLRQQVLELTIQIDEVKRARQVEEVISSDAFAHIAARAAELRRHTTAPAG